MQKVYKYYNAYDNAMKIAKALLVKAVQNAISKGALPNAEIAQFVVEMPADIKNGDLASNIAMVNAKTFSMAPQKIAIAICDELNDLSESIFDKIEIAGPGFINFYLSLNFFIDNILAVLDQKENFGKTDLGNNKKINVEYVSANPTGPMHLGNARGGAMGNSLCACLEWAGYDVTSEFYINDAGNQIVKFKKSLAARYMQIYKGDKIIFPEDGYQGEDIKVLAQEFADIHGDKYVEKSEDELQSAIVEYALPKNINALKVDLQKYNISYDVWFKESLLHESGAINEVIAKLKQCGACYEKDGAVWYRSSLYSEKYGANKMARKGQNGEVTDEQKDEVLVRANGIPTYFAADIAYHYNKFKTRGFETCINLWGADHHGHVARLKGAMDAIGLNGEKLDIILFQFVRLLQNGEPVKMSKRTGKAITLNSLLNEVPIDSARFFFNMREAGSAIDFDLDLAAKQDSDNPVYYVQYAHARICSILKKLDSEGIVCNFESIKENDLSALKDENEIALMRTIALFPFEIAIAAKNYEPARITKYATLLATQFHKFYNNCHVNCEQELLRNARTALCKSAQIALCNALNMLKISVPEAM